MIISYFVSLPLLFLLNSAQFFSLPASVASLEGCRVSSICFNHFKYVKFFPFRDERRFLRVCPLTLCPQSSGDERATDDTKTKIAGMRMTLSLGIWMRRRPNLARFLKFEEAGAKSTIYGCIPSIGAAAVPSNIPETAQRYPRKWTDIAPILSTKIASTSLVVKIWGRMR